MSSFCQAYLSSRFPPLRPFSAECRRRFLENLKVLRGVTPANTVDNMSPPLDFKFIKESILGKVVTRITTDFMSFCTCTVENGRSIGYTVDLAATISL